jgi:hypothetical protein
MAIEGDPDQSLVILTPEPASPTAEALGILARWTGDTTSAPRTRRDTPTNSVTPTSRADQAALQDTALQQPHLDRTPSPSHAPRKMTDR